MATSTIAPAGGDTGVVVDVGGTGVGVAVGVLVDVGRAGADTLAFIVAVAVGGNLVGVALGGVGFVGSGLGDCFVGKDSTSTLDTTLDSGGGVPAVCVSPQAITTASSTNPSTGTAVCLIAVNMNLPLGQYRRGVKRSLGWASDGQCYACQACGEKRGCRRDTEDAIKAYKAVVSKEEC